MVSTHPVPTENSFLGRETILTKLLEPRPRPWTRTASSSPASPRPAPLCAPPPRVSFSQPPLRPARAPLRVRPRRRQWGTCAMGGPSGQPFERAPPPTVRSARARRGASLSSWLSSLRAWANMPSCLVLVSSRPRVLVSSCRARRQANVVGSWWSTACRRAATQKRRSLPVLIFSGHSLRSLPFPALP